jgi:Putative MetA-pathway of phenol degradation
MHTRVSVLAVLAFVGCAPAVRFGSEPLVTDRPDFTDGTSTMPVRHRQLETGATFTRIADRRETTLGEALLRAGLTSRAELRVGLASYAVVTSAAGRQQGMEDASLGAKIGVLHGGGLVPATAVLVVTSLPTGATPFRSTSAEPEAKLIAAWQLGDRVEFATNLNYAWRRSEVGALGEVAASGSLGLSLTDRVGLYAETFGVFPREASERASSYSNVGLMYVLNPNLQLDLRGGVGHNGLGRRDVFSGVGVSRRW